MSAFYPTITLGGTGGFESTHISNFIQGPSALWSLGAQATQLLLDGGLRRATTQQARDLFEASASNYKGAVFLAFTRLKTSCRICGFWSRKRRRSMVLWMRRSGRSISLRRATRAALPAILRC